MCNQSNEEDSGLKLWCESTGNDEKNDDVRRLWFIKVIRSVPNVWLNITRQLLILVKNQKWFLRVAVSDSDYFSIKPKYFMAAMRYRRIPRKYASQSVKECSQYRCAIGIFHRSVVVLAEMRHLISIVNVVIVYCFMFYCPQMMHHAHWTLLIFHFVSIMHFDGIELHFDKRTFNVKCSGATRQSSHFIRIKRLNAHKSTACSLNKTEKKLSTESLKYFDKLDSSRNLTKSK